MAADIPTGGGPFVIDVSEHGGAEDTLTKRHARMLARARRDGLDAAYRAQASAHICCTLAAMYDALPQTCPMVASYAPMGSEVDVSPFAAHVFVHGGHLAMPVVLKQVTGGQRMQMRRVTGDASERAPFIVQPARAFDSADTELAAYQLIDPGELDLIVVPMLGYDACGMRLGYGGGCYDRYLPELSHACRVVGVAFTEQELSFVPHEAHDIALPRIITERFL